jgi:flagellar motility protein MotE (MotC chaperone)
LRKLNELKLKEINEQKKELDLRAKEIESKEKELADKELQLNDTLQKLSDKLISIQEQVQYLEKVDNAKAMQIIMSMDDKATAVQILRNMKKEKASAILALMDPLQAAQILEDLANEPIIQDAATKP